MHVRSCSNPDFIELLFGFSISRRLVNKRDLFGWKDASSFDSNCLRGMLAAGIPDGPVVEKILQCFLVKENASEETHSKNDGEAVNNDEDEKNKKGDEVSERAEGRGEPSFVCFEFDIYKRIHEALLRYQTQEIAKEYDDDILKTVNLLIPAAQRHQIDLGKEFATGRDRLLAFHFLKPIDHVSFVFRNFVEKTRGELKVEPEILEAILTFIADAANHRMYPVSQLEPILRYIIDNWQRFQGATKESIARAMWAKNLRDLDLMVLLLSFKGSSSIRWNLKDPNDLLELLVAHTVLRKHSPFIVDSTLSTLNDFRKLPETIQGLSAEHAARLMEKVVLFWDAECIVYLLGIGIPLQFSHIFNLFQSYEEHYYLVGTGTVEEVFPKILAWLIEGMSLSDDDSLPDSAFAEDRTFQYFNCLAVFLEKSPPAIIEKLLDILSKRWALLCQVVALALGRSREESIIKVFRIVVDSKKVKIDDIENFVFKECGISAKSPLGHLFKRLAQKEFS